MIQEEAIDNAAISFADPSKSDLYFEFACGVIIQQWSVLQTAVSEQWAGPQSADIRDWIGGQVVDFLRQATAGQSLDDLLRVRDDIVADIEELLLQIMLDEFDANLEDESAFAIAKHIVQIYLECAQKNFDSVRQLYKSFMVVRKSRHDDTHLDEYTNYTDNLSLADSNTHLGIDSNVETGINSSFADERPMQDDDGFTVIQRRKKGGNHWRLHLILNHIE